MGKVIPKSKLPRRDCSNTGWSGFWQRNNSQNFLSMAASRPQSGFRSPTSIWEWFPSIKNCAQSRSFSTGIEKPHPVFRSVLGIGRPRLYRPTSLWQSLSAWLADRLANFSRPPDLAAASLPTSLTKPLADRMIPAQAASAKVWKKYHVVIKRIQRSKVKETDWEREREIYIYNICVYI